MIYRLLLSIEFKFSLILQFRVAEVTLLIDTTLHFARIALFITRKLWLLGSSFYRENLASMVSLKQNQNHLIQIPTLT